jgi:uncharacterized protein (DUF433 family)
MYNLGQDRLAADETIKQLLDAYPRLTHEAIWAALAFTKEELHAYVVRPVAEAVG